jgi:hypothetical protein
MKSFLIILFSFFFSIISARNSFRFLNVYSKSYDLSSLNSTTRSYLWGASGQIAFFLDRRTLPIEQIWVRFEKENQTALTEEELESLSNFGRIVKNDANELVFSFSPTQIAASEYDPNLCGLFSDEEYTFDIDMPIYRKDRKNSERFFLSFLFDLKDQGDLEKIYDKLNEICLKNIQRPSFVGL